LLHPRSKHHGRYDLDRLSKDLPLLGKFIIVNPRGEATINFFDPDAVKALNKAILLSDYNVKYWDIPQGYLCPPIPGRADYIHHLADLLAGQHGRTKRTKTPKGREIRCLDIGTGANCIYPILGHQLYGWSFKANDIDPLAIKNAKDIILKNGFTNIEIVHTKTRSIFKDVLLPTEHFKLSMCNPPFHESAEAAQKAARRKVKNLSGSKKKKLNLNFAGQSNELWTPGGELAFIQQMIEESMAYGHQIEWFTTLVSSEVTLKRAIRYLKSKKGKTITVIPMGQGQKKSRILAWKMN
jgi:23S rRNA (adenine1618-N6)-methyltransferase